MKQVIKNYTFNAGVRTITLTDFNGGQPVLLERIALITDTTTNKILYNFADASLASAAVTSNNVITLSVLQGGEADTDKLRIDYDVVSGDATYDSVSLPAGAATAARQDAGNTSLASIDGKITAVNTGAVTISAALPAGNNNIGDVDIATLPVAFNTGTRSATTQRVTIATDDSVPVTGTFWQATQPVSGTVTAGNTSGDVAHDDADSGNPVKVGGIAKTALPSAVADGDRVNALFTKTGKQVAVGTMREMVGAQTTTITSSTSETTIVTADGTYFLDLYGLILTNTSATATKVTIKDATAGTTRMVIQVPATDTRGFMLPVDSAHKQAASNNNWTATCGTSVDAIEITALYVKNL